jgi:hypothetical protein
MPSPGELLSRGFSMGGKVKNAELAAIAAGINASGHYTRRGNNRRANEAKAQAMLKWYTNAEGKGKEGGKVFQTRRNFARNLAAALAVSPSGSRAASPASSRASSRGSRNNRGLPVLAAAGAGANKPKRTYTRKTRAAPPASGTWPLLKKSRQLWTVKVIPSVSRGKATVSKLTGKEGGKLVASSHNVTVGKAGRSPLQQALHEAEGAYENKVADGYTEVRSIHRSRNNELKSINNFVPN